MTFIVFDVVRHRGDVEFSIRHKADPCRWRAWHATTPAESDYNEMDWLKSIKDLFIGYRILREVMTFIRESRSRLQRRSWHGGRETM